MSHSRKRSREDSVHSASSSRKAPGTSRKKPELKSVLSAVEETSEVGDEPQERESQVIDELVSNIKRGAKQSEENVKNFNERLRKDKKRLKEYLDSKVKQALEEDTRFRKDLQNYLPPPTLSTVKFGLSTHVRPWLAPNAPRTESHPLFTAAAALLSQSEAVLDEYDSLCKLTEAASQGTHYEIPDTWKEDREEAARLLENGKRISLERIQKLILGDRTNTRPEIPSESWYNETSAYFRPRAEDRRLRDSLHHATKGVKRIVKELPEHDI